MNAHAHVLGMDSNMSKSRERSVLVALQLHSLGRDALSSGLPYTDDIKFPECLSASVLRDT